MARKSNRRPALRTILDERTYRKARRRNRRKLNLERKRQARDQELDARSLEARARELEDEVLEEALWHPWMPVNVRKATNLRQRAARLSGRVY